MRLTNRVTAFKSTDRRWFGDMPPWSGLEYEIKCFKRDLPGWWYSIGECQVSSDASCAPTRLSPHIAYATKDERFNGGFHVDLEQPSKMADALAYVRKEALEAIREITAAENATARINAALSETPGEPA